MDECSVHTTVNEDQITIPSLNLKVDQYEVSIADFGTFIQEQKYRTILFPPQIS